MKIGYSCFPLTINARANKRIVSKNFSNQDFIKIFRENLINLKLILVHNIEHDIHLFRISSDILDNSILYDSSTDWTSILSTELKELATLIKDNDIRITMFPQKYTLLNSSNLEVVKKSIASLEQHVKFMKALELDTSHKIILEIGGVYTNKRLSIERFLDTYSTLSIAIKERLVLTNDIKNYTYEDVLDICRKTSAPMLLNILYDKISNESTLSLSEKLKSISETWNNTSGKMIVHYSQQNHSKKKGEQSDTIFTDKFMIFYDIIQKFDTDITLETNDSEISVYKCKNIINELNGCKISNNQLLEEYNKYKLLLIEKGNNYNKHALEIANTSNSIIELYKFIDKSLESFIDKKGFTLALKEALKLISDNIKHSEKNHLDKLMLNNKLKRYKSYMYEVALRNNTKNLLETYFFSQL